LGETNVTPDPQSPTGTAQAEQADYGVLESLSSDCIDAEGDGALGGDLTAAHLLVSQGLLFITFDLAGNVQATDFASAHAQILSYRLDGNGGYIIGTTFSNGTELANFVFDNTEARQENQTNGVVFADGTIAMRVPLALVDELSNGFTWRTTLTVNDVDVDECAEVTVPAA
jgi:hypothetical protein